MKNPCSNPEPHEIGSLPCCEGLIPTNTSKKIKELEKLKYEWIDELWQTKRGESIVVITEDGARNYNRAIDDVIDLLNKKKEV